MIIEYIPSYNYFSRFVNFAPTQTVLDFGSNCGNLLKSSRIDPGQYTGIDVDAEAIDEGKKLFPDATWLWYNRYNPVYNPYGTQEYPSLGTEYDLVVSYSVFSHIEVNDMLDLLEFLYSNLSNTGKILFSYCNVNNGQCVEWFRNRRIECDEIPNEDIVYLIDNKVSKEIPEKCNHFVTFYKTEWLLDKLSKFNPISYSPPVGWVQDCMILNK
jgi:SAM-dependent methyltransferase